MSTANEAKFRRVFDEISDIKERVIRLETHSESEAKWREDVSKKLDYVSSTLHEIIGRETVRAGIYAVVGAIVSGVIVLFVSWAKESMK